MPMFTPFVRYADFSGRARRLEFWLFQLFQGLVYLLLIVLAFASLGNSLSQGDVGGAVGSLGLFGLMIVFALGCFLPNLAVTVRRLHDSGKSAWWLMLYAPGLLSSVTNFQMLGAVASGDRQAILAAATQSSVLSLVAFGCNLVMLVLMILPGTSGDNRFGSDPKGGGSSPRTFDVAEDDSPPSPAPHKPVFDFGPGSSSPARGVPAMRQAAPTAPRPAPSYGASGTGRPTFGKRR